MSLSILMFAVSQAIHAENRWHTSKIENVYPQGNGGFVIIFTEKNEFCLKENGTQQTYHYVRNGQNGVTQEGTNKLFSTALAAAMSGKEIAINFDDPTKYCYINRIQMRFI